jgi:hypothetical protein
LLRIHNLAAAHAVFCYAMTLVRSIVVVVSYGGLILGKSFPVEVFALTDAASIEAHVSKAVEDSPSATLNRVYQVYIKQRASW